MTHAAQADTIKIRGTVERIFHSSPNFSGVFARAACGFDPGVENVSLLGFLGTLVSLAEMPNDLGFGLLHH